MFLKQKAQIQEKSFKAFIKTVKKQQLNKLDDVVHALHKEAFEEINCLECANCCKTLGPRLTDRDIEQMAHALRIKPRELIERYLRIDEDKDYVFKEMPCPFLDQENYCVIYKDRPKACREYPHTDRKKFYQIYSLAIKNAGTCPAVFQILNKLRDSRL